MVEVEYPDHIEPKMKLSEEKATYPYRKQVWRESDEDGAFIGDTIGIANEQGIKGEKLLNPVMQSGKLLAALPSLKESQVRAQAQLLRLPAKFKAFTDAEDYPVRYSDKLQSQRQEILARLKYES
jgi:nicotinate phosphoribosyltransferase